MRDLSDMASQRGRRQRTGPSNMLLTLPVWRAASPGRRGGPGERTLCL